MKWIARLTLGVLSLLVLARAASAQVQPEYQIFFVQDDGTITPAEVYQPQGAAPSAPGYAAQQGYVPVRSAPAPQAYGRSDGQAYGQGYGQSSGQSYSYQGYVPATSAPVAATRPAGCCAPPPPRPPAPPPCCVQGGYGGGYGYDYGYAPQPQPAPPPSYGCCAPRPPCQPRPRPPHPPQGCPPPPGWGEVVLRDSFFYGGGGVGPEYIPGGGGGGGYAYAGSGASSYAYASASASARVTVGGRGGYKPPHKPPHKPGGGKKKGCGGCR